MRLGGKNVNITAPTKTECIRQAQLVKAEYKAGKRQVKAQAPTLGEAIDRFIRERSAVLSPSTIRGYRIVRRNRFQDYMDKQINQIDWQEMVNKEAAIKAPKTVKNAWGLVSSVLAANGIAPGKIRRPQAVLPDLPWLNVEQLMIFLPAIKGTMFEIPALIDLHSLRSSEMQALTWEHSIDLQNWRIKVSGALVPDENNKMVFKAANKTAAGKRTVPIFLQQLKDALLAEPNKTGPVVKLHPETVRNGINRICRENGLPEVGHQGLRRSFASACQIAGLSERECMEIGGWSDIATMHRHYVRLSDDAIRSAAEKLEAVFKTSSKTPSDLKK